MKKLLFALALICMIACKQTPEPADNLGEVRFEVSGSPEAQIAFEKGLLLLHSFEYRDAREAFQLAKELDPKMPMAYWGEAMTHNHPLWSEQDYDDAQEVFVHDFVEAWTKVMTLDRFDLES